MVSLQKGSNTTKYSYDDQNRLQSVSVGGLTAATYTYDGDGGRTEKTVYRRDVALYNDNTNLALFGNPNNTPPLPATAANTTTDTTIDVGNLYEQETDATNGSARNTKFIYFGDTKVAEADSAGNVFYYHTDNLGGTNVLSDQTGALREFTFYDPFGQVLVHEKYGNTFATAWYYFTGKPLDDETGLIFLGARYYNPSLGRFITPDTLVQAPSNPQTLNRYTYCNNNPVNLIDPTGHSWWKKFWHGVEKVLSYVIGGVFGAPYVMAAFQGNWGMVAKGVLNIIGLLSGNPFFMISAGLSIASDNVAYYGGPKELSQGLGYASLAFAVAGGIQMISQAFQQASIQQTASQLGLSNSPIAPSMSNMSSDQLTAIMNNSSPGITVVDKTAAAQAEIALANSTGSAIARVAADAGLAEPNSIIDNFYNGFGKVVNELNIAGEYLNGISQSSGELANNLMRTSFMFPGTIGQPIFEALAVPPGTVSGITGLYGSAMTGNISGFIQKASSVFAGQEKFGASGESASNLIDQLDAS